jgi:hypothetical protein
VCVVPLPLVSRTVNASFIALDTGVDASITNNWNTTAQILSRPLWERCLQLVCWAGWLAPTEQPALKAVHEDTVQPLLSILTKASEPALVLMLVQLPILISTLARDKKELSGTTWWNGTAECLSSIMTTGGTEAQVSAAYGLGILARIGCNPGAWGIEHGSCPRPTHSKQLCQGYDSTYPTPSIKRCSVYLEFLKPFWRLASRAGTLSVAAQSELLRVFAIIIRRVPASAIQEREGQISHLLELYWSLLLDSQSPRLVRFVLATEAGALFTGGGAKVRCNTTLHHALK